LRLASKKGDLFLLHTYPGISLSCLKIGKKSGQVIAECWEYGKKQINSYLVN